MPAFCAPRAGSTITSPNRWADMTDTFLKLLAFAFLAGFLGILFLWVPRIDLGIVLGITLLLAGIDFFWKRAK